jgi:hypothetical protein
LECLPADDTNAAFEITRGTARPAGSSRSILYRLSVRAKGGQYLLLAHTVIRGMSAIWPLLALSGQSSRTRVQKHCGKDWRSEANNIVEQDHRAVKRITKPMMGFKSFRAAGNVLAGIELMHMIRKGQMMIAKGVDLSFADQFYALAA